MLKYTLLNWHLDHYRIKWLDEQFQTWTQIITARILSDPVFKLALLDSSARKMCVQRKLLTWPSWITIAMCVTRGQVLV